MVFNAVKETLISKAVSSNCDLPLSSSSHHPSLLDAIRWYGILRNKIRNKFKLIDKYDLIGAAYSLALAFSINC